MQVLRCLCRLRPVLGLLCPPLGFKSQIRNHSAGVVSATLGVPDIGDKAINLLIEAIEPIAQCLGSIQHPTGSGIGVMG